MNTFRKNIILFVYLFCLMIVSILIFHQSTADIAEAESYNGNRVENIADRISSGERILVTAKNTVEKRAGVKAFKNQRYAHALMMFEASLEKDPNDPETLAYLSNTIAAETKDFYKIGVVVPIGEEPSVAQEILRGVVQAQNAINRNDGIDGKLIMVEIVPDDKSQTGFGFRAIASQEAK